MREGMVTPCRPRSHYRCRVSVLAAISFGLGGLLGVAPHYRRRCLRLADRRTLLILAVRFGAGRVLRGCVFRLGLRVADRLWLRVTDRLGLRVADRLGQHLMQLSLRLRPYFFAHRSSPVTGETRR